MTAPVEIDREQVLASRLSRQGLERREQTIADLAVLDLGVQEASGTARIALAARLADRPLGELTEGLTEGTGLALAWTHRGAPHLHRADDLVGLATALWPVSEADAGARMGRAKGMLTEAGISRLDGLRMMAEAWHDAVAGATPADGPTKGELSRELTGRLPGAFSRWCGPCECVHVNELLFRIGSLPGGAQIVEDRKPLAFAPIGGWSAVPTEPVATSSVIHAYLHLLGPATPTEAGGYIGTSGTAVKPAWPDDLVAVRVQGRSGWIPEGDLDDLRRPSRPGAVRLLPASDPYLQTRDRDLIVPDPAHQKVLWRILGNPGAVLANGEIVGAWRSKQAAKGGLEVTVTPFVPLARGVAKKVDTEAERVGQVRGATSVVVHHADV